MSGWNGTNTGHPVLEHQSLLISLGQADDIARKLTIRPAGFPPLDGTGLLPFHTPLPIRLPLGLESVEPPEAAADGADLLPGPGRWKSVQDIVKQFVRLWQRAGRLGSPINHESEPNDDFRLGHGWAVDGFDVGRQDVERGQIKCIRAVSSAEMADNHGQAEANDVFQPGRRP